MVLERDEVALEFIEKFRIATSKHISDVAYKNIDIANRRLRKLTDAKFLYRVYNPLGLGYLYSTNKIKSIKQLKHNLLRNEFYFKLLDIGCEIEKIEVEPSYGSIRPDALCILNYNGVRHAFLLEVETSNNTIDTKKYNNWWLHEYKEYLKVPIPVVYVTSKSIKNALYRYEVVNLKLSNIEIIFN